VKFRQDLRTPLNQLFEKSDNLIVISSYEVIRNDIDFFNKITWNYIILDEGHAIRLAAFLFTMKKPLFQYIFFQKFKSKDNQSS